MHAYKHVAAISVFDYYSIVSKLLQMFVQRRIVMKISWLTYRHGWIVLLRAEISPNFLNHEDDARTDATFRKNVTDDLLIST